MDGLKVTIDIQQQRYAQQLNEAYRLSHSAIQPEVHHAVVLAAAAAAVPDLAHRHGMYWKPLALCSGCMPVCLQVAATGSARSWCPSWGASR
jgi:hypothetical protein